MSGETIGRAYPLLGIAVSVEEAARRDAILSARVHVCGHTGDAARLRELEAEGTRLRHSLEAADSAVRTAHAHIERLERIIRSNGLAKEAGLR